MNRAARAAPPSIGAAVMAGAKPAEDELVAEPAADEAEPAAEPAAEEAEAPTLEAAAPAEEAAPLKLEAAADALAAAPLTEVKRVLEPVTVETALPPEEMVETTSLVV